jgi:hypothetical protein
LIDYESQIFKSNEKDSQKWGFARGSEGKGFKLGHYQV